jgi:hypothetical protein
MTLLAPSKAANEARGRVHKTSIDWTISAVRLISRWLKRPWVLIGDGGFACLRLGHRCRQYNVTLLSRLRLDAALYEFPTQPPKGQRGRHRVKGQRAPSLQQLAIDASQPWQSVTLSWYGGKKKAVRLLSGIHLWYSSGEKPLPIRWVLVLTPDKNEVAAFFSTDVQLAPEQIVGYFVLRWNIEVTFAQTRAHLGIETQRQWSDKAIARTTPMLMALFSLTCLVAIEQLKTQALPILSTAWYDKKGEATFSDILTFVRRDIWACRYAKAMVNSNDWNTLLYHLAQAA